jgi:hypothetical protein
MRRYTGLSPLLALAAVFGVAWAHMDPQEAAVLGSSYSAESDLHQ